MVGYAMGFVYFEYFVCNILFLYLFCCVIT